MIREIDTGQIEAHGVSGYGRRGRLRGCALAVFFLLEIGSAVAAKTIVVSPGGKIQATIDQADDYDTVLVGAGWYLIQEPPYFGGKRIILQAESGPEETFIEMFNPIDDLRSSVFLFDSGEDQGAVVDGFTIDGGGGTDVPNPVAPDRKWVLGGGMLITNHSSPTIKNCRFINNVRGDIACIQASPAILGCQFLNHNLGVNCWFFASPRIENCLFEGNYGVGIQLFDNCNPKNSRCEFRRNAAGMVIAINSSPVIQNCLFQENLSTIDSNGAGTPVFINCIIMGNGTENFPHGSSAIRIAFPDLTTFINCLILGNQGHGFEVELKGYLNLIHCTIAANEKSGISVKSGGVRLQNCLVWGNREGSVKLPILGNLKADHSIQEGEAIYPGEGNSNRDPEFRRAASIDFDRFGGDGLADFIIEAGDYRLRKGSPAIDQGANLPDLTTFDLDSNPRPCGQGFDLGAYEYCGPFPFRRGDADGNGELDLSDAIFTLLQLFAGGASSPCLKAADADDSGELDVSDAVHVLRHLFAGGPPPADPFDRCGEDATEDALSCIDYDPCGS